MKGIVNMEEIIIRVRPRKHRLSSINHARKSQVIKVREEVHRDWAKICPRWAGELKKYDEYLVAHGESKKDHRLFPALRIAHLINSVPTVEHGSLDEKMELTRRSLEKIRTDNKSLESRREGDRRVNLAEDSLILLLTGHLPEDREIKDLVVANGWRHLDLLTAANNDRERLISMGGSPSESTRYACLSTILSPDGDYALEDIVSGMESDPKGAVEKVLGDLRRKIRKAPSDKVFSSKVRMMIILLKTIADRDGVSVPMLDAMYGMIAQITDGRFVSAYDRFTSTMLFTPTGSPVTEA